MGLCVFFFKMMDDRFLFLRQKYHLREKIEAKVTPNSGYKVSKVALNILWKTKKKRAYHLIFSLLLESRSFLF